MRRKLLLADDSITVQRVIELTFSDEGLDIVTVGDGAQAIERLPRERPDIVLVDVNMPGADGYAVAEQVKRAADLVDHTRVVLLTGAFEPVDQERARRLGVDGVLAKPFEPHVAIALVRQLLEKVPLSPPGADAPVSDWTAAPGSSTSVNEPAAERAHAASAGWGAEPARSASPAAEATSAVAAGYPFEPGAATTRSTPEELDDYFKRLDEALTNAGLTASPAVRTMLAESREATNVATVGQATPDASGGISHAETPGADARVRQGGEERQVSGVPSTGAMNVTLVDAFSALLAAEQVVGPAGAANADFWVPTPPATPVPSAYGAVADRAVDTERAEVVVEHGADTGTEPTAYAAYAAPAASSAPAVSEAQIEAIVRRVVEEMSDRLVREIVQARVLDVAERLVREEIERLKAAAADESAPSA